MYNEVKIMTSNETQKSAVRIMKVECDIKL